MGSLIVLDLVILYGIIVIFAPAFVVYEMTRRR